MNDNYSNMNNNQKKGGKKILKLMNGKITQQFEIHCRGILLVIHSLICQGENLSINYFIPPYQLPRQRDTLPL